jgi:5-methylcytosine-specific restriction endonuclease McrA
MMAQPKRGAHFFCRPNGVVIPKARALKRSERNAIYYRDGGKCQLCGRQVDICRRRSSDALPVGTADHILPRSRGGQNVDDNLRLLCESCNASKGGKLDEEWDGGRYGSHPHH